MAVEISDLEHMVVLALSHSKLPFRLHVDVGSRFPSLISATGRLVAAFGHYPADEIERRFRALRWQERAGFRRMAQGRRAGPQARLRRDRGNYINGVAVVAVPVFDRARASHAHARRGRCRRATRCGALCGHRGQHADRGRGAVGPPAGGGAMTDPALDGWKARTLPGFIGVVGPLWTRREGDRWAYGFWPRTGMPIRRVSFTAAC